MEKVIIEIIEEVLGSKVEYSDIHKFSLMEMGLNSMMVLSVLMQIEEKTKSDLSEIFDEMETPNTVTDLISIYKKLDKQTLNN